MVVVLVVAVVAAAAAAAGQLAGCLVGLAGLCERRTQTHTHTHNRDTLLLFHSPNTHTSSLCYCIGIAYSRASELVSIAIHYSPLSVLVCISPIPIPIGCCSSSVVAQPRLASQPASSGNGNILQVHEFSQHNNTHTDTTRTETTTTTTTTLLLQSSLPNAVSRLCQQARQASQLARPILVSVREKYRHAPALLERPARNRRAFALESIRQKINGPHASLLARASYLARYCQNIMIWTEPNDTMHLFRLHCGRCRVVFPNARQSIRNHYDCQ